MVPKTLRKEEKMSNKNWKNVIINPQATLKEALSVIDKEALRVALVVDNGYLVGTVTDGDIRRAILNNVELTSAVKVIMNRNPMTASIALDSKELKQIMQERDILALPLVGDNGELMGLKTLQDTLAIEKRENPIFIMAGGFGTRLRPLTDKCPKPMLKVGDKPMLERLIENFKAQGFYKFYISTHYLPEVIMSYFGNGEDLGVEINYVHEEKPLGTGGALSLLPENLPSLPLIMINGDILTNVDFNKALEFHEKHNSSATMCVRDYQVKIPFGVIEGSGHDISSIVEKPTYRYFVNAGIYVISHEIIQNLEANEYLDMPSLFESKKSEGFKVSKFPIHEYWLDIGRHDDYEKAQLDIVVLDSK